MLLLCDLCIADWRHILGAIIGGLIVLVVIIGVFIIMKVRVCMGVEEMITVLRNIVNYVRILAAAHYNKFNLVPVIYYRERKFVALLSAKIIQLNEYGCRDAPCKKSWKQGNPLAILSRILAQSCVTICLNYVGRVTHDCASILDSIAKGISLFPRFFAWCIPTSILNVVPHRV